MGDIAAANLVGLVDCGGLRASPEVAEVLPELRPS